MINFFLDAQHDTQLKKVAMSGGGEWAGPCPFCGGDDRFHVQPGQNRWLCRMCTDAKWKDPREYYWRRDRRIPDDLRSTPIKPRKQPAIPSWRAHGEEIVRSCEQHPRRFELWNTYKPLSQETIEKNRLGVGVLPASKCHHSRLIVPVWNCGSLVCLRGRAIECDCPKWLASGGWTLDLLPLYNEDALYLGCNALVCENPIDALMVSENQDLKSIDAVGIATFSIYYWTEQWTFKLRQATVKQITIAYDNDEPGQKRGIELTNKLQDAGLRNVYLFPWGESPLKDIGNLLTGVRV